MSTVVLPYPPWRYRAKSTFSLVFSPCHSPRRSHWSRCPQPSSMRMVENGIKCSIRDHSAVALGGRRGKRVGEGMAGGHDCR